MKILHKSSFACLILFLSFAGGCGQNDAPPQEPATEEVDPNAIALAGDWDARLPADALEQGRLDAAWTRAVSFDTTGLSTDTTFSPENWEEISTQSVNIGPTFLPLHGNVEGPSVLRAQILLDRVLFSPGIIDGHWGKNTEKAIYWFQQREGLRGTGRLDQSTFDKLVELSGGSAELIRAHQLTAEDVEGPFVAIPEDIYEKAELDCLCYESLSEKLGEMFHTSPDLLQLLNPGIDLNTLGAGTTLQVPSVRDPAAAAAMGPQVARLEISSDGFFVHALDASGRIVYHFPSTLGSSFDPSPEGDHSVTRIAPDPWWHYQPSILAHVDDSEPEARIPPGPNNAVGVVWMALSIPHYGIHGTSAPETIGYTTSAGCIRLTNWDAIFLSERIQPGIPVTFRTTGGASAAEGVG